MADKFKACSVVDCNGNAHSSKEGRGGFCRPHYRRMRRHGDPLGGKAENGEPKRFYKEVVLPYEGDECIIWPYNKSASRYGVSMSQVSRIQLGYNWGWLKI